MNPQHLQAFLGLRWRLFINQMKRGGIANAVILTLLAVMALLLDLFLVTASFLVGLFLMPEASPAVIMYVWDGMVVVFLFWWGLGILTDLQRSEALSLDKFLHLPVSLSGAFLINYVSSLLSLSMIFFLPAMAAFTLGLVFAKGPAMLFVFPLLAAFLMMVTALTYQFQGWLASLMANKRRRQTIIVMISMSAVLFCQLPNLFNLLRPWNGLTQDPQIEQHTKELTQFKLDFQAKKITKEQFRTRLKQIEVETKSQAKEREQNTQEAVETIAQIANLVLPPGWLPLGAKYLAEGNFLPAFLGTLGMALIGSASLWRAYGTTLRYYTGKNSGGKKPVTPAQPVEVDHSPAYFLEKKLPWLSEQAAAIALAGFRSLLRAPEAKILLLSPLIMVVVFGSMFMMNAGSISESVHSLLPFAAMAMVLFGMVNVVGNQFGFDRSGFRVFVLCPAPRQDILLGKNLAIAPLTLGLGGILTLVVIIIFPMRLDYLFRSAGPDDLDVFGVLHLANWLSIISPMAIRAGSFKAGQPKGLAILLNLAFVFLFPVALLPTLLPLGIEVLLNYQGILEGMPICLVLTLLECAGIIWLYRLMLTWQGSFLQSREQKILEIVAVKSE